MNKYHIVILPLVSIFLSACDSLDPEEIRKRQHFPGKDFVADKQKGKLLYADICARCHGVDVKGTKQGPPLLNKVYRPGHHADITFHWAVKNGVSQHHWQFGNMPAIKNIAPETVGHIIAFVRQEQRNMGIQ